MTLPWPSGRPRRPSPWLSLALCRSLPAAPRRPQLPPPPQHPPRQRLPFVSPPTDPSSPLHTSPIAPLPPSRAARTTTTAAPSLAHRCLPPARKTTRTTGGRPRRTPSPTAARPTSTPSRPAATAPAASAAPSSTASPSPSRSAASTASASRPLRPGPRRPALLTLPAPSPRRSPTHSCSSCQQLHGAPLQWAAIFKKDSVLFDEDSLDHIGFYDSREKSSARKLPCKVSCKACHSPLSESGRRLAHASRARGPLAARTR